LTAGAHVLESPPRRQHRSGGGKVDHDFLARRLEDVLTENKGRRDLLAATVRVAGKVLVDRAAARETSVPTDFDSWPRGCDTSGNSEEQAAQQGNSLHLSASGTSSLRGDWGGTTSKGPQRTIDAPP